MQEQGYNGWTNYETWVVGLYLDGNYDGEGTYLAVLELVRETADNVVRTWQRQNVVDVADALESFVSESLPDLGASLAADLLGAAIGEVNWQELAAAKLAEIAEES